MRQFDDTHLRWVVSHKDRRHEFDTEISEQRSDERVAWKPTDGTSHAGARGVAATGTAAAGLTQTRSQAFSCAGG